MRDDKGEAHLDEGLSSEVVVVLQVGQDGVDGVGLRDGVAGVAPEVLPGLPPDPDGQAVAVGPAGQVHLQHQCSALV